MTAAIVAPRTARGEFHQEKALQEAMHLVAEILRVRHFPLKISRTRGVWIHPCNCGTEYRSTSYTAVEKALSGHFKAERSSDLMRVSTR